MQGDKAGDKAKWEHICLACARTLVQFPKVQRIKNGGTRTVCIVNACATRGMDIV